MSIQDLLIRRHRKSERGRWRENGKVSKRKREREEGMRKEDKEKERKNG